MVADESALVLVLPDDTVDTIIAKVRETGAAHVQLLVPDGVTALQSPAGVAQLRTSTARNQIELQVITSDEATLDAARVGQLVTIGVSGTRVTPFGSSPIENGGASIPAVGGMPALADRPPATAPDDDELFAALDDLSDVMSRAPHRDAPPEDYDAFAAELDALSDFTAGQPDAPRSRPDDYDAFAAELDDWGDISLGESTADTPSRSGRATPAGPAIPPRPRIRPEDIELTDDEKRRASGTRGDSRRSRQEPRPRARAIPARRSPFDDEAERFDPATRRARRPWFMRILPVLLILLLLVIALLFFLGRPTAEGGTGTGILGNLGGIFSSETVVVTLPSADAPGRPFTLPIPLIEPGSPASATAVKAAPVSTAVEYSVTGEALSEAPVPAGTANGIVTIFSSNTQPIELPAGTEFIGTNPAGQEVRFAINEPVVIPASSVSDLGAQIIINRGQAQAGITAQAPGSAGNIDANTISQIIIPGQTPIVVNQGGAIRLQHDPIGGGNEQMVRIVREEDAQRVLGEALIGLNNQAPEVLQAQVEPQGLALEESTLSPQGNAIVENESYTMTVNPPFGTEVDPANPAFTVTVSAIFAGLATPAGNPLQSQLQPVVSNQLAQQQGIPPGMAVGVTSWQWDGSRLMVDGVVRRVDPTTLDASTRAAILNAVRGKSRAEAEAALENFVQQGVIADYTLPNVERLPERGHQLTLEVQPAPAAP